MVFAIIILSFAPILFLIGLIKIFWKTKVGKGLDDLGDDLRCVALVLDKLGNVTIFNWLDFSSPETPKYGDPHQTISEVLFIRSKVHKLTFLDGLIFKLIDGVDKGHFEVFEPKELLLKDNVATYVGVDRLSAEFDTEEELEQFVTNNELMELEFKNLE